MKSDWLNLLAVAMFAVLLLAPLAGAQPKDTEDAVRARYGEMLQRVAADPARYTEKWRPQYHFSAPQDWINDPNGLVFFNGKYRMSFQHRHPLFQGMSWGSAVSTDLVHWQVLPPAILKDDLGNIFSGTAAVDWKDTSGFFGGKPGLLAMFTYSKSGEVGQTEGLAYSRDGGDTWQKFEGNPVIPNYGTKIFIDPKLFWHEPTKRWIAFVGGHGKMRIYSSPNAREWTFESTVEEIAAGGEVADVFQLPVNGDTNNLKWVWSAGGNWFVVGAFDGHRFTPETDRIPFNAGPNAYAMQTWSDMPATDTRRIATYWMTGYSRKPELTGSWCGALTLPRELSLLKPANGSYRIAQRPIRELESLRDKVRSVEPRAIKAGQTLLPGIGGITVEIVAEFKLGTAKRFGLKLLKGGKEETLVGYDVGSKRMFLDRSQSGYTRLLDYAKSYSVELLPDDSRIRLHIFADVSIVELYGNEGVANMTAMVLPSPASKDIALFSEGGEVELTKLDVYELKSIWGGKPASTSNVEVAAAESPNPFEAQFISNVSRWVPFSDAAWKFVSGGLEGRRNRMDASPMRYVAETKVLNGTFEADITLETGAVAGLSVRDDGSCGSCRRITLDEAARTITFYEQNTYVYTANLGEAKLPISKDGKYHLKIEAVGAHYRIWLDGVLLMEADDQPQCKSSAGYPLLFVGQGGAVFQNVVFKELFVAINSLALSAESGAPVNLRCEYLKNPQGIDIAQPRLSWQMQSDQRGARQTAYRVLVATSPEMMAKDKGDLWDSGKVVADQSTQIVYAGKPLDSRALCYWKVKVWDGTNKESSWSPSAQWSMGLLKPSDWSAKWISMQPSPWVPSKSSVVLDLEGAQWIWLRGVDPNMPMGTACFNKTISIREKIKSAVITITGDDQFTLKINGKLLGKTTLSPNAWASPLSVDLKGKLNEGDNVLEVQSEYRGGTGGIVARVQIVPEQGKVVEIGTDASWKSTDKKEQPVAQWQASQEIRSHGIKPRGKVTTGGQPKSESGLTSRNSPTLRKVLDITKPVKSAQVSICGLGYYEMFLNGTKVGDHVLDPAWTSYHKNALYVTYDISKELRQGSNAIGVQLANGMYNQEFGDTWNIHKAPWKAFPQMILQLDITYDDGTKHRVVSDGSWKVSDGPIYWDQLRMGVMYDARREQPGWNTAGFDDSKWQPAILREGAKGKLAAQMSEPIKVMDTLKAVNITKQDDSYVFDFGQNISGWTRLNISGKAGTEIVMDHNETKMHLQTSIYTLKGVGTEIWEPNFAFYGFGKVAVTGLPGEPSKNTVEARIVHTAFDERGAFECSNPLLNKIVSMCRWSYVDNFVGIPTDCPHREKLGWTADAHLASEAGLTYFGSEAAYTRWMLDFEAQQAADGKLPCIVPDTGNDWGMRFLDGPAWESAYLIIPWYIYEYRGDRRILERHYESYKRWIAWYRDESKVIDKKRFEGGGSKDSKYKNPQKVNQGNVIYYGIGDWPPNGLTPFEITSTAYYYNAAKIIAATAHLLGKSAEEKEYSDLAANIRDAFNRAFYDEATGTYSKGSDTGMSCALSFGLVEDKNRQKVADHFAEGLRLKEYTIRVGCLGSKYLLRALAENGHLDTAYRVLTKTTPPGWGFLAASDRTTLSENMNGGGSDNHAFLGDVASWMMQYLAGIRFDPAHPGFKHFLIKPEVVGDLTWVKAHHDSAYGRIESKWKKEGNRFSLNVTVPANSAAEVFMPASKADEVNESGGPAVKAKGVKFLRMENGKAIFEVGSGVYSFECTYDR